MPLSFERRWSLDRRKDDKKEDLNKDREKEKEKKNKKEKKKYKTKLEEQMAHQIEELNRQVVEERQNTRREKLSVARLQRELAKAKTEGTMKETTMRELAQEREARVSLEKQLEGALAENKSRNAQLEALQGEIARLRSTESVESLCDNAESCISRRLQSGRSSMDSTLSDVERENCNVVANQQVELKVVCKEEGGREADGLMERMRQLETENSSLVLENENQRNMYDQCLDEVANQIVQALLMQKDLRDECLKLHGRVRDLEHQNHNLKCMFDQNRYPSSTQSSPQHQYGARSPYASSPSSAPTRPAPITSKSASATPSRQSSSSNGTSPAFSAFTHPLRGKARTSSPGRGRTEPPLTGSGPDSGKDTPPRFPSDKTDVPSSPGKTPDRESEVPRDGYQKLVRQQYQQYHQQRSQPQQHQQQPQRMLPQDFCRQLSEPVSYAHRQTLSQISGPPHNNRSATHNHGGLDHEFVNSPFLPYSCDAPGEEGAGEGLGLDLDWVSNTADVFTPMRQSSVPGNVGRLDARDESLNGNLPLGGSLGARLSRIHVMGEDRIDSRHSQSDATEGRNGFILDDQYTKPFVHAPFHYAQSLLKELQEISASVKSFESLTLEPKANHQQKRKANDGQSVLQRQKLPKNLSPSASNTSSESLSSATSPKHMMMDSASSVTSMESIETTLERIPPTIAGQDGPLREEYQMPWRPEYGDSDFFDSRTSQIPADTPSPPTTDVEPSHNDLEQFRFLRSRQYDMTHQAERESSLACGSDSEDGRSSTRGSVSKAVASYQEKVVISSTSKGGVGQTSSSPSKSLSDKDTMNEAQRSLERRRKVNEGVSGKSCNLPVRDSGKQTEAVLKRSKFNGKVVHKHREDVESCENFDTESVTVLKNGDQVKPKLNRQFAAEGRSQSAERLPREGARQLKPTFSKNGPLKSRRRGSPSSSDVDHGDSSSPIWKRKSQMEEYILSKSEEILGSNEETRGSLDEDVRVPSFMTAPDTAKKEEDVVKVPKPGSRTQGEASPTKNCPSRLQVKPDCKTSLPVFIATGKPSVQGLSRSVGSIAKTTVGVESETKSLPRGGEKGEQSPKEETKAPAKLEMAVPTKAGPTSVTCEMAVSREMRADPSSPQTSKSSPTSDGSPDEPKDVGKVGALSGKDGSINITSSSGSSHKTTAGSGQQTSSVGKGRREATESLLQKSKMQFTRGEVGRSSLGSKTSQLSKAKTPSPSADHPFSSRPGAVGRGPLAMAASSKQAVNVPVLDSSPKLPGRRHGFVPPLKQSSDERSLDESHMPGEMAEFTSQSLVESMSIESLQSANSLGSSAADWDSPTKTNTSKQSSHLSALLSSDSDSEEEEANVNFVDMWRSRSTPPIKLPDWDPNKSIEEHRKRVRESLERSESASSASSEQWILSHPMPEDLKSKTGRSGSTGMSPEDSKTKDKRLNNTGRSLDDPKTKAGQMDSRQSSISSALSQADMRVTQANSCEEDRRILEELLEKERIAESRSGSSEASPSARRKVDVAKDNQHQLSRQRNIVERTTKGSPRTKRKEFPRTQLPKPNSGNSVGEKSIMSDFVSSIMAEVHLNDSVDGKASARRTKDDLVQHKKQPSNQFIRSKSMRVTSKPSKPERTRVPSGGSGKIPATNAPKTITASNKLTNAKKSDATSTKSPIPKQTTPGTEVKKSGLGLSRTSFMPKALTRTTKPSGNSPNVNQSRSGVGGAPTNGPEKSVGKSKKTNAKNTKAKAKNESSAKPKAAASKSSDKESSSSEKDLNLKNKSRIPQMIKQGFKSSPEKADPRKKKVLTGKDIELVRPGESFNKSKIGKAKDDNATKERNSPANDVISFNKTPSFVVDNVPFIDDSSKSPSSEGNSTKTPSPTDAQKPFSGHQEHRVDNSQRNSPKLSPRMLERLRARGVELANSSGSDNDSVFLPDEPSDKPVSHVSPLKQTQTRLQQQHQSPSHIANGSPALRKSPSGSPAAKKSASCSPVTQRSAHGSPVIQKSASGSPVTQKSSSRCGSELHLDEKEIEDIKNGVLVSDADAHSIGSWSAKSSELSLKNTFLFGNGDFGNVGTPSSSRRSLGRSSAGRGSLAPSVSSNPEDACEEGRERAENAEVDAKKIDVPLVSTDLMEDFEAEELREEDGMSSDREKEAQLTEKERANLLDSLFESDESDGGLDGFLDESTETTLDSHPDEHEFMKLIGDKGLKRQVIRQSMYCRVSLLQMDIYSHYNRFDNKEKEALACFDFLEEVPTDNGGEAHFTDDHPLSVISPGVGRGVSVSEQFDDGCYTVMSGMSESGSYTGVNSRMPDARYTGGSGGMSDASYTGVGSGISDACNFSGVGSGISEQLEGCCCSNPSSGARDCFDVNLQLQAGETTGSHFGDDPSEVTLTCDDSFASKRSFGGGAQQMEGGQPTSGKFSEHFEGESFGGAHHSNKVFDGCYAIGDFGDQLGNISNLCSSMSSSSTASLSSHE